MKLMNDGTLSVEVDDATKVTRVLVEDGKNGDLYYADIPQGWIPCSERVPKWREHIDDMVLVCYADGSVRFNTFMNWRWVQGEPIAWMPLPKPWKGADDE